MSAGGYQVGSFIKGILELFSSDQAEHMGGIVNNFDVIFHTDLREIRYWFRKQKKTLPHDDQLRPQGVDQIFRLRYIDMVTIFGEREINDILSELSYRSLPVMADMPPSRSGM